MFKLMAVSQQKFVIFEQAYTSNQTNCLLLKPVEKHNYEELPDIQNPIDE